MAMPAVWVPGRRMCSFPVMLSPSLLLLLLVVDFLFNTNTTTLALQPSSLSRNHHRSACPPLSSHGAKSDDERNFQKQDTLEQQKIMLSRRLLFQSTTVVAGTTMLLLNNPEMAAATTTTTELDPRAIVTIRLESAQDRLGLQLGNTSLRGKSIVVITGMQQQQQVTKVNKKLQPGMILLNFESAKDVVDRIQSGPFPLELNFYNLAAGGDAFNDIGQPMVTAQDALDLAKQTDEPSSSASQASTTTSSSTSTSSFVNAAPEEYSITTLHNNNNNNAGLLCAIKTRRGDLLEIDYEATALLQDGRRIVYDASAFRGTGLPYQMVLGSGDMLPGVDLGLYDMCPGQERLLKIPPRLAYGPRGNKLFKIPPETPLEWKVKLVTIDATIREDNNDQTREEREARALY